MSEIFCTFAKDLEISREDRRKFETLGKTVGKNVRKKLRMCTM
jgi:hypothetical protein